MGVIVPNPTVRTEDGATSVTNVKQIEVTDGTLTDDGSRTVTIETGSGGATPSGSDYDYQFKDGSGFGHGALSGYGNYTHTVTIDPHDSVAGTLMCRDISGTASKQFIIGNTEADGTLLNKMVFNAGGGGVGIDDADGDGLSVTSGIIQSGSVGTGVTVQSYTTGDDTPKITLGEADGGDSGITLEPAGTGVVTIYSNSTDPTIKIESASNAIELKCDATNKLQIDGAAADTDTTLEVAGNGTGSSKIVMTSGSSTGGITFPDGTEQTTAASGGGTVIGVPTYDAEAVGDPAGQRQNLFSLCTLGTSGTGSTATMAFSTSSFYSSVFAWPFMAPFTGDIDTVILSVESAYSGGSEPPCKIGVYTATSDNEPGSLLGGEASLATDATGYITATFSSTVSLTAGTLYYLAFATYSSGASGGSFNLQGQGMTSAPFTQFSSGAIPGCAVIGDAFTSASDSLPATFSKPTSGSVSIYRAAARAMVREGS